MRRTLEIAVLAAAALWLATAPQAAAASAQSRACTAQAKQQGLTGAARTAFRTTCMKGGLAPKTPTRAVANAGAAAVVAPSGADRTSRSAQCNAEAARRGLHDAGFQSFRKGCLASAAPVGAIETAKTPTKPTAAKPKLESLTNTPPK